MPIVVVLGATGAGKSKLALEVAQKFGGEIISADAMQMYKGLDIVTNKVSAEEQRLVKHHMIDFLDPLLKSNVVDFRNQALPIIQELQKRNVMPVICGGTNYYIESLLWNILVQEKITLEPVAKKSKLEEKQSNEDENMSNEELYEKLKSVDPTRAQELHPNERRKILRSLQVFKTEGKPHSEILKAQKLDGKGGPLGGGLRFPLEDLAILWVQCDQNILDERCDKRVDKMIAAGLVDEMGEFHKTVNEQRGANPDYTVGIFQSIGFKEFHDYLLLSTEEKCDAKGQKCFDLGKAQMMLATRQYARRQTKWIRQRFLRSDRQCPPVYALDSTDPKLWHSQVYQPAVDLLEAWIAQEDLSRFQALPVNQQAHSFEDSRKMFYCDVCSLHLKGRLSFEAHTKSRKHYNVKKKFNRGEHPKEQPQPSS